MSKSKSKTSNTTSLSVEERYQKMEPHEHILALPDTYIGSIEEDSNMMWVLIDKIMYYKEINYIPGLYKIYDEILVNSRDHSIRDPTCTEIRVSINRETGEISCMNNGQNGIPIQIHKDYNIHVPELIFGNLLTSEQYHVKGKTVGGKNGYGAKLANIFSTHFYVEVFDHKQRLLYKQDFYDNMYKIEPPKITKNNNKNSYTLIKFTPDYKKFNTDKLSDDMIALFEKRVYDLAACTNQKVSVYLNDELIQISTFKDYVNMFYPDPSNITVIYEEPNDRWKVCAIYDPDSGYRHISYVNGICTYQGGSHVNHVVNQITSGLLEMINKKNKSIKINNSQIKENLTIFIDSVIEDPSFSSQTKENMTSKVAKFGSKCTLSDIFITSLGKSGLVDAVVNLAKLKELSEMKKTDGNKKSDLRGIAKLDDAVWAGTKRSVECTLILTEGDSAKTLAVAGTEVVGKERFGVFPLKGKLLNVREATAKQLLNNEEIKNIKKILGLKQDKEYNDVSELRYGSVLLLTDQDVDGFHIKGLLMNFIHYFWPSLMKYDGFIKSMATPILKIWKKSDTHKKHPEIFYNLTEFDNWKQHINNINQWTKPKYYKGLGTSTSTEAREYFNQYEKRVITYVWNMREQEQDLEDLEHEDQDKSQESILLAFSKEKVKDRKTWLLNYDKKDILDNSEQKVIIHDFINKELKHFSFHDIERSIPNLGDGFKPSQRRILYAAFYKKLFKTEVKVSQLAGSILEVTDYHSGEMSLHGAIIKMAQDFIGSNNINTLRPNGGFGSRLKGGEDHASPRYIFTQLSQLSHLIFREEDNTVLDYTNYDGMYAEPDTYAPIIPMILINGSKGIGTGFSTDIPCFNIKDVIKNIKNMINKKDMIELTPWYRGFLGTIKKIDDNTFETRGLYSFINNTTVRITELPVEVWTEDYYEYLTKNIYDDNNKTGKIKEFIKGSGVNFIDITIVFVDNALRELIKSKQLDSFLKITNNIKISNMHLHTVDGRIKKYETVNDIMEEYYDYRLKIYIKRKEKYMRVLKNELNIIKYKVKFLEHVIDGTIVLFVNKKTIEEDKVINKLEELEYPRLSHNIEADDSSKTYNYITDISLFSLTKDRLEILREQFKEKLAIYKTYKNTKVEDIWIKELDELETEYDNYLEEWTSVYYDKTNTKKNNNKTKKPRAVKPKARK